MDASHRRAIDHGSDVPQMVKNGLDGEAVEGGVGLPYAVPNVHVDYQLTAPASRRLLALGE